MCPTCNEPSIGIKCQKCGTKTSIISICPSCRTELDSAFCERCKKKTQSYTYKKFPLKEKLVAAQEKIGIRAQEPFKGVKELISQDRISEPLEKGLIRQNQGLTVFKDGTIRYDATNCPLTHYKPNWVGTSIEKLVELGYEYDADGKPLTNSDQIIELKMQDVVIPIECAKHLLNVCKYVDMELEKFYGREIYYGIKSINELVGHLLIGLAPHTSVGIVGRVIGFTNTHVCFGTPNWHSACYFKVVSLGLGFMWKNKWLNQKWRIHQATNSIR